MYDRLETNLPHPWMSYSDMPFSSDAPLYPSRKIVSAYLERYAKDIKHLIKFHTQVTDIKLKSSDPDVWSVRTRDLRSNEETEQDYDAVAVCTGHYTVPYCPDVPGIAKWKAQRPGSIIHSKYFRRHEPFAGQKVLIVGNSLSAFDISAQIRHVAQSPVLLSQKSPFFLPHIDVNKAFPGINFLSKIEEFLDPADGRWAVRFSDGSVEEGIDKVIYCTGYFYSFPFLGSLEAKINPNGFRVHGTYKHVFNIDHPTLVLMMLPMRVQPFPLSEVQAAVVARVWSGRLSLPSPEDMRAWEAATLESNGDGKKFHTLTHPKDYEYQNDLYDWAAQTDQSTGKMGRRWNDRDCWYRRQFLAIRMAYAKRGEERYYIKNPEEIGFDYEAWKSEQEKEQPARSQAEALYS